MTGKVARTRRKGAATSNRRFPIDHQGTQGLAFENRSPVIPKAAKVLGVARHTLSRVLNGRAAVSPAMAIRLEKAGWSNAEFWLRRQTSYDLAQARKGEHLIKIKPYPTPATSQKTSPASRMRESPRTSSFSTVREGG